MTESGKNGGCGRAESGERRPWLFVLWPQVRPPPPCHDSVGCATASRKIDDDRSIAALKRHEGMGTPDR